MLSFAAGLAFLSGFVALGYEILWARRLADVIGATSLAAALVVGVFFVMLAWGAIALGPRAARTRSPWRLYAILEAAILAAILPAFWGDALAAGIAHACGDALFRPGLGLFVKVLLTLLFVGPASFCMGGTLPALGQAVVRTGRLGRDGNLLYGANTLGGAAGIVVTTFGLAPRLGVHASFGVLMAGSAALAALAAWRAQRVTPTPIPADGEPDVTAVPVPGTGPSLMSPPFWHAVSAVSGFLVLGLEVLAIHLYSQVLNNSTYTFAAVLIVVIATLAGGAFVVQRWRAGDAALLHRLGIALLLTGLVAAVLPRAFFALTHGMQPFGGGVTSLLGYVMRILGLGALLLGPLFLCAGMVFPIVLAGAGLQREGEVGQRWGRLLGWNAAGALVGLVVADFVAMRLFGLWISITLWALAAIVAGWLVAMRSGPAGRTTRLVVAGAAVLALVAAFPGSLPVAALHDGDRVLGWRAGPDGVAAAIERAPDAPGVPRDLRIKWNNTYSLGGTANAAQQARMGQIALLLHPHPERTGFIGVATGITASAALRDPAVRSVTAAELSPQVTELACRYFADSNANLCGDGRVQVVVEDGRLFFRATRQSFDVIVGDLFVPWQAGTANLYTREQFTAVRDRLAPGGLFAQWLPVFQLDPIGFFGIAATFKEVFPNAWLAVADFQPYSPAIALIGWRDAEGGPSYDTLAARCTQVQPLARLGEPMLADAEGVATFLVGPIAGLLPPGVPPLTLDKPWLADHAPRVQRMQPGPWFVGAPLASYLQRVASGIADPRLQRAAARGQLLYQFCELTEREGIQRAAAWFDANAKDPLPPGNFAIPQPERLNWPFTQDAGMYLVRRALAEGAAGSR